MLRRLQHRRVAAEHGRERLPGVVRQRRVERDDQRGDADRPPRGHHRPVRHRGGAWSGRRAPALARDEEAHLDRCVRLAERELERLSGLLDDGGRDLVAPSAERERQLADELAALDRRARRPGGLGRRAAATAAATSSASERGAWQSSSPSAGRSFSKVAPEAAGTASPPTRFATVSTVTVPVMHVRVCRDDASCARLRARLARTLVVVEGRRRAGLPPCRRRGLARSRPGDPPGGPRRGVPAAAPPPPQAVPRRPGRPDRRGGGRPPPRQPLPGRDHVRRRPREPRALRAAGASRRRPARNVLPDGSVPDGAARVLVEDLQRVADERLPVDGAIPHVPADAVRATLEQRPRAVLDLAGTIVRLEPEQRRVSAGR